jgi:hypothetical protein
MHCPEYNQAADRDASVRTEALAEVIEKVRRRSAQLCPDALYAKCL